MFLNILSILASNVLFKNIIAGIGCRFVLFLLHKPTGSIITFY